MDDSIYGGIEAGGTKYICAVGTSPENIIEQTQIPTTTPSETLRKVVDFFEHQPQLKALGVASFGPLDLNKQSPIYGYITTTPKDGWRNTNLVGALSEALNVPIALETDVNGAALAEQKYGAGQGLPSVVYMTVGTGIGVGYVANGKILNGIMHTEMGHMLIPRNSYDEGFASACSYHDNCLEGLASGTALQKRWGVNPKELNDQKAWDLEAHYLAAGIVNVISCTMPMKIIIGGGVMKHPGLIEAVRLEVTKTINGYLQVSEITSGIDDYIVSPKLGRMSGVLGALEIARNY
jgi:fructokinase